MNDEEFANRLSNIIYERIMQEMKNASTMNFIDIPDIRRRHIADCIITSALKILIDYKLKYWM